MCGILQVHSYGLKPCTWNIPHIFTMHKIWTNDKQLSQDWGFWGVVFVLCSWVILKEWCVLLLMAFHFTPSKLVLKMCGSSQISLEIMKWFFLFSALIHKEVHASKQLYHTHKHAVQMKADSWSQLLNWLVMMNIKM